MAKPVTVTPTPKLDLKTRMAKAVIGKTGSLIPVKREEIVPPPAKKEKDEVPDMRTLVSNAAERLKISRLVAQLGELNQAEREIKKAKTPLVNNLKTVLGEHSVAKAICGDYKINYFNAPRKTLDPGLLMQHGVSIDVINASYKVKDAYTLKVSALSGEDEEDEG